MLEKGNMINSMSARSSLPITCLEIMTKADQTHFTILARRRDGKRSVSKIMRFLRSLVVCKVERYAFANQLRLRVSGTIKSNGFRTRGKGREETHLQELVLTTRSRRLALRS